MSALQLDLQAVPLRLGGAALPWALDALVQAHCPRFPPGEVQLEALIATIEDAIMPLLPAAGRTAGLAIDAVAWTALQAASGVSGGTAALALADVEQLFNRLADVAAGALHRSGLPDDARFAVMLVLVREVMHHAGAEALVQG